MLIDLPTFDPPAIVQPMAPTEIRRRRGGSRSHPDDRSQTRSRIPAWVIVGAVVILTDRDGQEYPCHVVHVDHATGVAYCSDGAAWQW